MSDTVKSGKGGLLRLEQPFVQQDQHGSDTATSKKQNHYKRSVRTGESRWNPPCAREYILGECGALVPERYNNE